MKLSELFSTKPIGDIIALCAGALLTLAFAPFGLFPLAIISPALLLASWIEVSPRRAFLRGWLFGLGFFGTGVYWVFISIHTYGYTSISLATFITSCFIALLALFPALNGYLLKRYFSFADNIQLFCAFPAIWVLLEWIRSWIFTGFPWLYIGYSQLYSPLKGFAPIMSVYGVSLAALITSSLLVLICINISTKERKISWQSLAGIIIIWMAGGILTFISWTQPKNAPIKISLVQGNIEQDIKWSMEQTLPTLTQYANLTRSHWDSKIIIWPESAITLPLAEALPFIHEMEATAQEHHATIISGIPIKHPHENTYYNAVIAFGNDYGFYLKHRLVPFGEYTPFPSFLPDFLQNLGIPVSNSVVSKDLPEPLHVQGLQIATFICYEIAFPEQVLQRDGNINLLLTVNNDGWFGHSIAQAQHLQMAAMRALEMGRPVLFVSNTGITAIIKPNGHIQSSVAPYQVEVLTDSVQAMAGKTPWQKRGMDPVFILIIVLLYKAIRAKMKQRKKLRDN